MSIHVFKKHEIAFLQGFLPVKADGYYGRLTEAAMIEHMGGQTYTNIIAAFIETLHNEYYEINDEIPGIYDSYTANKLVELQGVFTQLITEFDRLDVAKTASLSAAEVVALIERAAGIWHRRLLNPIMDIFEPAVTMIGDAGVRKAHIDTRNKVVMLLGQIRVETGPRFRVRESLDYGCDNLNGVFKHFRNNPDLAYQHGRCDGEPADQVAIANIAYASRMGNGDRYTGDGFKFRGSGLMHTTFIDNYRAYKSWLKQEWGFIYDNYGGQHIVTVGADKLTEPMHAMMSAISFWVQNGVYTSVKHGITRRGSDAASALINPFTGSKADRWAATKLAYKLTA